MTRLILLAALCAIAWHYAAPQREYVADLWRDVERLGVWPTIER